MEYVKRKEALKALGICYKTLYKMADNKSIDTIKIGELTLYNINKYLREHNVLKKTNKRFVIVECQTENKRKIWKDK